VPKRPENEEIVNVAIRFPTDLHEQAKRLAAREDLTLSQLVRRVLRGYLDAHASSARLHS
jgi:predicted HicB family RNase H-like nuclease